MRLFRPLLTKEELQLPRDQRRALRDERIAERRGERRPRVRAIWHQLKPIAEDLISDVIETKLDGREKLDEVVDTLVDMAVATADTFLIWTWTGPLLSGPLEAIDGAVLNMVIRGQIETKAQALYDAMKAGGRFDSEG